MSDIKTFFPIIKVPETIYKLISTAEDGAMYKSISGLGVIVTGEIHDNKLWLHVSLSRAGRIPDYKDITIVKKHFIGEYRKAIMVFPDKDHHVNIMPYCLHLFCAINGDDGLPEFSRGGMIWSEKYLKGLTGHLKSIAK